jgi:hypothetical protein
MTRKISGYASLRSDGKFKFCSSVKELQASSSWALRVDGSFQLTIIWKMVIFEALVLLTIEFRE